MVLQRTQPGPTIPAHRPRIGLHSFLTPLSRLGPSHRVPSIVECKELIRVQTFVTQLSRVECNRTSQNRTLPQLTVPPRTVARIALHGSLSAISNHGDLSSTK